MQVLDGKVAVITGAGSGIGRALAEQLAKEGCALALADINQENLESLAAELRLAQGRAGFQGDPGVGSAPDAAAGHELHLPGQPQEDAPPRPAPVQRPPVQRAQPVQVYRAGDKSEHKRLLMQKKQGKA